MFNGYKFSLLTVEDRRIIPAHVPKIELFFEYSTIQLPEHSGGFEWFRKRFTKDEVKEVLVKGGYENNIVDDPDEINKALEEYKKKN